MSMDSRLRKVEDVVGGSQITAATPEEMASAFLRGEYGPPADLFRTLAAGRQVEEGRYPEELIDHFLTLKSKRGGVLT